MKQSLTREGGQGERARDMLVYSAWRVTEPKNGLGVVVANEDAKPNRSIGDLILGI